MGFIIENGVLREYVKDESTEIVIPNNVTSIGDYAFRYCINLTSVTIPNNVTSIGNSAFRYCTNLTSVTIPNNVTDIGNYAFYECKNLSSVTIGNNVTSIGERAFCWCESLTSITIPNGVTSIGDYAFAACKNLTSITIPDSVTSIGNGAFSNCERLTSITIPDSVTSIGDWAFSYCYSLTSVTISDSVTDIVGNAFWGCRRLKKLPAFGYIVDGTRLSFEKVAASEVKTMLSQKDYSVKMEHSAKYQFVAQVFLQDGQPEAEAYIKKNISKILPYFIDIGSYWTVKSFLESGKFVNEHNIMEFVDYAIENTQKGGDMQIQVLIMNYRNKHFPDIDPLKSLESFKL